MGCVLLCSSVRSGYQCGWSAEPARPWRTHGGADAQTRRHLAPELDGQNQPAHPSQDRLASDKNDYLKYTPGVTSDNASGEDPEAPECASDNSQPLLGPPRRGRQPGLLPPRYADVHTAYEADLAEARMLDEDTRRAYTS